MAVKEKRTSQLIVGYEHLVAEPADTDVGVLVGPGFEEADCDGGVDPEAQLVDEDVETADVVIELPVTTVAFVDGVLFDPVPGRDD